MQFNFSYNAFLLLKKLGSIVCERYNQNSAVMSSVITRLQCIPVLVQICLIDR